MKIKQIKAIIRKNPETGEDELVIDVPVNEFLWELIKQKRLAMWSLYANLSSMVQLSR